VPDPAASTAHRALQCLTAMRFYAAGARRSLADGQHDRVAFALVEIERQIDRAHAVLVLPRGPAP